VATATGVFHTTYRKDLALRHTRAEYVRLGLLVAVAVWLPFGLSTYWLGWTNLILLSVIAAVGLNILLGYTGLISLATAGFLGVGAYTAANLAVFHNWPMIPAVLAATVLAALIGAFFGLPALRLKGLYLAISTFAAQEILEERFRAWKWLTTPPGATREQGNIVTSHPSIGSWQLNTKEEWYWVLLVITGLIVWGSINLFRTGLGRAFVAIRDQDIAAEVMGVPVGRYKVLAFSLACGMAGFSGAMQAFYLDTQVVTWENYVLEKSFLFVAMIIIGGLGSVSGAIYGAAFLLWLPNYINQFGARLQTSRFKILIQELSAIQLAVFGLILVVFLLVEPRGLARLWQRVKDYFRLWPFRY
jgi:branched-chain amino acid transport system permease protein